MANIDDAARRTREAIANYDTARALYQCACLDGESTPEQRGKAQAESDVALIKVLGATEYLLEIIYQERNVIT